MFGSIVAGIGVALGEAFCLRVLKAKQRRKLQAELDALAGKSFAAFAGTSLDSPVFASLLGSARFKEMLRKYIFSLDPLHGLGHYRQTFLTFLTAQCPELTTEDADAFGREIEALYVEVMGKLLKDSVELKALLTIFARSHREIIEKIGTVQDDLQRYLTSLDREAVNVDHPEVTTYHHMCAKDFSQIKFTGISVVERKRNLKLDDFYVENCFSYFGEDVRPRTSTNPNEPEMDSPALRNLFDYNNKVVLLGGAGLGKTTTLNYLFCHYESLFGIQSLKVKLDLKEHAASIGGNKQIFDCLADEIYRRVSRATFRRERIEGTLAGCLERGECLIILDALDEIPAQSMRDKVRDEIETFCNVYYLNRFIITSREAGYLRNRFDESFLHVRINSFSDDQIRRYSKKWFKGNALSGGFPEFWEKFEVEIERARCREIIRNPIMLILALVIFDVEKNLPNRRVEFYRKCVETFLHERESRKEAFVLTDQVRNILSDDAVVPKIAFYKFEKSQQDPSYRFTGKELWQAILEALETSEPAHWAGPVRDFAEYLVDRTELIAPVDEDVYDFAHKTFFEYFLARYFAKNSSTAELKRRLNAWIGDPNLDELGRLLVEVVVEKNDAKQHDDLIRYLFAAMNVPVDWTGGKSAQRKMDRWDAFRIIAELYDGKMLQIKYHVQYYDCLLKNADLAHPLFWDSDWLQYDPKVLAERFYHLLAVGPDALYGLINSLFCLSEAFRDAVARQGDELIKKTCHLAEVHNLTGYGDDELVRLQDEARALMLYFMHQRPDVLARSPEIYLALARLASIISMGDQENFAEPRFQPNGLNILYLEQDYFFLVFQRGFDSPEHFLMFATCLVLCGKGRINEELGETLTQRDGIEGEVAVFGSVRNAFRLYRFLNAPSMDQSTALLKEYGVHSERYGHLYCLFHELYQKYDKRRNSAQLREIMVDAERDLKLFEQGKYVNPCPIQW